MPFLKMVFVVQVRLEWTIDDDKRGQTVVLWCTQQGEANKTTLSLSSITTDEKTWLHENAS